MKNILLILFSISIGSIKLTAQEMIKSVEYSGKFDVVFYNETDSVLMIPNISLRYRDAENLLLDQKFYNLRNDTLVVCFQSVVKNVSDLQISESTENTKADLHYNEIALKPHKKYHQYFIINKDPCIVSKTSLFILFFNGKKYQSNITTNSK